MIRKNRTRQSLFLMLLFFSFICTVSGQLPRYSAHGWQLLDFRTDGIFGAGVNRSYAELLKGKKSWPVVVAVIDRGIDTAHEDLQGHIWTNTREIPGNKIDDDHNGYVDDIHGWNFLGATNGDYLETDSYESYREYHRLTSTPVSAGDSAYFLKVKRFFLNDSTEEAQAVLVISQLVPQMRSADSILKHNLHKDSIFSGDVTNFAPRDSSFSLLRKNTLSYFRKYGIGPDISLGEFINEAAEYLESARKKLEVFSGDPDFQRREIIGDRADISDRKYGNNNIAAGNCSHGTHVAGIIAAQRGNAKGVEGIDDNVFIMALRAVPDGDERDKDVALAIRYAVDNGARIVNMSFGKYFSPGKEWVDDAVRYASAHDVLIIHAAGNDARNIDSIPDYPSPDYASSPDRDTCCYLTVGASSGGPDSLILARFSNYGKKRVDLFAPGVRIYSLLPHDLAGTYSGTSMAAPVVTGVAALLLEYYPLLSARQLKEILIRSVMKLPDNQVKWAATGKTVDFRDLSISGGIVNAYDALQMAATVTGERKNP